MAALNGHINTDFCRLLDDCISDIGNLADKAHIGGFTPELADNIKSKAGMVVLLMNAVIAQATKEPIMDSGNKGFDLRADDLNTPSADGLTIIGVMRSPAAGVFCNSAGITFRNLSKAVIADLSQGLNDVAISRYPSNSQKMAIGNEFVTVFGLNDVRLALIRETVRNLPHFLGGYPDNLKQVNFSFTYSPDDGFWIHLGQVIPLDGGGHEQP